MLWPFVRVVGRNPTISKRLRAAGIGAAQFADPDTRLPYGLAVTLLEEALSWNGDPALGLRAAAVIDAGDADVLEHAARCCASYGDALEALVRYIHLIDEAVELSLRRDAERTLVVYQSRAGYDHPRAAVDFAIGSIYQFTVRSALVDMTGMEVWFSYEEPGYSSEHRRFFGLPVRFGAQHHALVLPRDRLAAPMKRSDPRLARAFQARADRLAEQIHQQSGTRGQLRKLLIDHIGAGKISMAWAARHLAMSVPTLRRHLELEGTTFTVVVDEFRRERAEHELRSGGVSVSEVAFMLGFSNVAAFHRAFRRWTGLSPTEYRSRSGQR